MLDAVVAHAQTFERTADRLVRDALLRDARGEADHGRQTERQDAGQFADVRELWCRCARRCSAAGAVRFVGGRWGWCDRWVNKASSPSGSKQRMTVRTVRSSQPRTRTNWGGQSLRALTSGIWQRRRIKASDEPNPASKHAARRPSADNDRLLHITKEAGLSSFPTNPHGKTRDKAGAYYDGGGTNPCRRFGF